MPLGLVLPRVTTGQLEIQKLKILGTGLNLAFDVSKLSGTSSLSFFSHFYPLTGKVLGVLGKNLYSDFICVNRVGASLIYNGDLMIKSTKMWAQNISISAF